jgi:hypothetical protein
LSGAAGIKAAWVQRVLGVAIGGAATQRPTGARRPGGAGDWAGARQAWQDANDAVNDQINALRSTLRDRVKSPDDDIEDYVDVLTEIAENGLNSITENHRVRLMAAVMEIGTGEPAQIQASGAKTLSQIQAFQTFLADSEKITVCDANPFGANVAIRDTLGPPLQRLAAVLQAGAGR